MKQLLISILIMSCSPNLEKMILDDVERTQEVLIEHIDRFDQLVHRPPRVPIITIEEAIASLEEMSEEEGKSELQEEELVFSRKYFAS